MEDEERAHRDAHFQEELDSLKASVASLTSLLEQALRNASGEGPSTRPTAATQTQGINHQEEVTGVQDPQQTPALVQSAVPTPTTTPTIIEASEGFDQDKMATLEARIRVIEGANLYDPVQAADMCLVPNVVIPKKFHVPEFIIYTGTQCPITHLKSYCNKMAEVVHDEKLLMHFFQDSLSGAALNWYMRLDNTTIRSWKNLVDAFIKQYKYNMDIALDRTSLSNLEKKDRESIREYAQRWRDLAAQVHPPLLDKEMVILFANTLRAPYYEHVMGSSAQQFMDAVAVAERIEQGIRSGRISAPVEKKGFEGKRKEVEHFEDDYKGRNNQFQNYHNPSSEIANINLQAKDPPKNFPKRNYQKIQEQLPPLPLLLNEMYQKLVSIKQVAPEPQAPLQPPYPDWYKSDLTCEYHAGAAGHSIHTCGAFKKKLMQLIKEGWITFKENPGPASS